MSGSGRRCHHAQKLRSGLGGTSELGGALGFKHLRFLRVVAAPPRTSLYGALRRVAECGWARLGGDHLLLVSAERVIVARASHLTAADLVFQQAVVRRVTDCGR